MKCLFFKTCGCLGMPLFNDLWLSLFLVDNNSKNIKICQYIKKNKKDADASYSIISYFPLKFIIGSTPMISIQSPIPVPAIQAVPFSVA